MTGDWKISRYDFRWREGGFGENNDKKMAADQGKFRDGPAPDQPCGRAGRVTWDSVAGEFR
jgi:hypothetical protein